MKSVYQHCSEQHLKRYLTEFDFSYNYRIKLGFNDAGRATAIAKGIEGKRLAYRRLLKGERAKRRHARDLCAMIGYLSLFESE